VTDDQLLTKVAELCGWKHSTVTTDACNIPVLIHGKEEYVNWYLPDYLTDLDAMAQAENRLTDKQYRKYSGILFDAAKIVGRTGRWFADDIRKYLSATARQRAEAFVQVMEAEQ